MRGLIMFSCVLALVLPATAEAEAVTPIPGCGSTVVFERGFLHASPEGQSNIAERVPAACV